MRLQQMLLRLLLLLMEIKRQAVTVLHGRIGRCQPGVTGQQHQFFAPQPLRFGLVIKQDLGQGFCLPAVATGCRPK